MTTATNEHNATVNPRPDLDVASPPPKPHITAKGVGLAVLFWVLYAVLNALLIANTENIPLAWAISGSLVANTFLAVYSLPVWWITIRMMNDTHWSWVLAAHVIMNPLYAWLSVESYFGVYTLLLGRVPEALASRYLWIYFTDATLYIVQFSLYHLVQNVRHLKEKEKQATELLARAREQELAALKAQINPHFLFNTLNSISATLTHDPERAREMIAKLAGMMRYALDSSKRDRVPLRDELEFVQTYLALEQHRFSDRLDTQVVVDVDEDVLDTPLPPMVLQPLVENALRHGIAPSEDGGTVDVRVASADNRIRIEVADTGIGVDDAEPLSEESEGVGLANTSARLERTFGPEASLQTAPNEPSGFLVWFTIPIDGAPTG